ncbi:MAG TPA: GNAT family protein [Gemmatimonadaceae bacterium]|nr:GNAT family protein [Gemmatimonadaceae bacterium]
MLPSLDMVRTRAASDDVKISRLEPGEQTAYRALRLECLRNNPTLFGTTYTESIAAPSLAFERFIATRHSEHLMFGAFRGGVLGGICGLHREQRAQTRHRGELVHMYVAPWMTGRGVGRRLIETVMRHGVEQLGLRQIVLAVVADNAPALRLYRRAGFREYGRLDFAFCSDAGWTSQLLMVYEHR